MAAFMLFALPLMCLSTVTYSQDDIRWPPEILQPTHAETTFYPSGFNITIPCKASGIPKPTYKWTHDGTPIQSSDHLSYDAETGTLTIPDFSFREEGDYRCEASNTFSPGNTATSLSPIITLRVAHTLREKMIPHAAVQTTEFSYVKLQCEQLEKGIVADDVVYQWYLGEETIPVSMDEGRLFIDREGSLHFSYVSQEDGHTDAQYRCGAVSPKIALIILGTGYSLSVSPAVNSEPTRPRLEYSSAEKVLRFSQATLECMFSGYDPLPPHFPVTRWYDDTGEEITAEDDYGKYEFSEDGRILYVNNVTEEDEGNYYCEAVNSAGKSGKQAVFLDVTSAPIFRTPDGAPTEMIVPEGQDVVFHCDARSARNEPDPTPPIWLINGIRQWESNADPTKFVYSGDNKSLTIKDVKKATDNLCVQCSVSNHVGTTWGNACLTVLLPITLLRVPELRQEIEYGDIVDLTVTATSDPSLRLFNSWEFQNETHYYWHRLPPYVICDEMGTKCYINTSLLTIDEFETINGTYRRVFYHNYETKIVDIEVVVNHKTVEEPVDEPSQAAFIACTRLSLDALYILRNMSLDLAQTLTFLTTFREKCLSSVQHLKLC